MKHTLTSKERRGLAAVAAAALLCIAAGPMLRACGNTPTKIENTQESNHSQSQEKPGRSDKSGKSDKSDKSEKSKMQKKSKKSKPKKAIPVRSPLDQPCD